MALVIGLEITAREILARRITAIQENHGKHLIGLRIFYVATIAGGVLLQ